MALRFLLYGLLGWCAEILWTALYEALAGSRPDEDDPGRRHPLSRRARLRLAGRTYLWMLPIYGSAAVLFEPAHEAVRAWPWLLRGLVWMGAIFAVEYAAGWVLRRLVGRCPWDYHSARWHVHGLIRLDYAPIWMAFGFLLERVHDVLRQIEPALRAALAG